MSRTRIQWMTLALLVCAAGWARAESPPNAEEVEAIRAAEMAARTRVVAVAPVFLPAGWEVELLALNTSWRTIDFRLEALTPAGEAIPVAARSVGPREHLSVGLPGEVLRRSAAVRLTYFDLPGSLPARLVHRSQRGSRREVFAQQLLSPSEDPLDTRWIVAAHAAEGPEAPGVVAVTNAAAESIAYELRGLRPRAVRRTLAPGGVAFHRLGPGAGPARIAAVDSRPGLVVHGVQLFAGRPVGLAAPTVRAARETTGLTTVTIPGREGSVEELLLVLANPAPEAQRVPVLLLDNGTGTILAHREVELPAGAAVSFAPTADWPQVSRWAGARLAVGPTAAGLAASGAARLADGSLVELSFFRSEDSHATGVYPVPDLAENSVALHLLNESSQTAVVAGQVSWPDGRYSLATFELEPGTARALDLNAIAAAGEPDLLGARLPASLDHGVLKWIALSGGSDLLGRLEITPADTADGFGVNCFGCCWSLPRGAVVPYTTELTYPNQWRPFTTATYYDTCSGVDGPYYSWGASLSYSWPFNWNGSSVSAAGAAEEYLEFSDYEFEIRPTCNRFLRFIFGRGIAQACRIALRNPVCQGGICDSSRKCSVQTTTCGGCQSCCGSVRLYNLCKKRRADLVQSEYNACIGHCVTEICS